MNATTTTELSFDGEEWDAIQDRLVIIDRVIVGVEDDFVHDLSAQRFDDLRGYLGAIAEARQTISELLNQSMADRQALIETAVAACHAAQQADECPPHGIERPDTSAYGDYDGKHPCIWLGCEHTVLYDDEPYCFTHSPDEGSSVRGYSYRESARLASTFAEQAEWS